MASDISKLQGAVQRNDIAQVKKIFSQFEKNIEELLELYQAKTGNTLLYSSLMHGCVNGFTCANFLLSEKYFQINELTDGQVGRLKIWSEERINEFLKKHDSLLQQTTNIATVGVFSSPAKDTGEKPEQDEKSSLLRHRPGKSSNCD